MAKVKENLEKFEEYKRLQNKIDHCDRLISQLKKALLPKKEDAWLCYSMYYSQIDENLGGHLTKAIGKDLILLIEAEKVKLLAQQNKIEIKGC